MRGPKAYDARLSEQGRASHARLDAIAQFLFHCRYEKNLSPKTLKAYSIDLRQFTEYLATTSNRYPGRRGQDSPPRLHQEPLRPPEEKSIKRKVATLKALFHFLEREDAITVNLFRKMDVRIKAARRLPWTVALSDLRRHSRHLYRKEVHHPDPDSRPPERPYATSR